VLNYVKVDTYSTIFSLRVKKKHKEISRKIKSSKIWLVKRPLGYELSDLPLAHIAYCPTRGSNSQPCD
jgi:hypothetical protein